MINQYLISYLYKYSLYTKINIIKLLSKFIPKKYPINDIITALINNDSDENIINLIKIKNQNVDNKLGIGKIRFVIKNYYDSIIYKNITNKSDIKYLDIGCSDGKKTKAIGELIKLNKNQIYGIDVETYAGMKNIPQNGFNYKIYDGKHIPYDDETFDFVTIIHVLHHVKYDIKYLIKEIYRVVKKGGYVFVRDHNKFDDVSKYIYTVEHLLYNVLYDNIDYNVFIKDYYENYYTKIELQKKFTEQNFEIVDCIQIYNKDMINSFQNNVNNSYNILFVKK